MFRTIEDFVEEAGNERELTGRVLRVLTDESLAQRVTPDGRSLGFLAWHLTGTFSEMLGHAGLDVGGPKPGSAVPDSAAAIASEYHRVSKVMLDAVVENWSDGMLEDDVPMYGQVWKRGHVLDVLIRHEAHHRGQMTVLMRQAGLPVPGPYGPGREEWAQMGMEAQP